jgi:hypothetical protein
LKKLVTGACSLTIANRPAWTTVNLAPIGSQTNPGEPDDGGRSMAINRL